MEHNQFSTLVDLARYRAKTAKDKKLYTFLHKGETESSTLSFQELDIKARAIASQLQQLNLEGERALLIYPSGEDYVCAFYACLYAGVTAVPVYPPQPKQLQRLISIVEDAKPAIALTQENIEKLFQQGLQKASPVLENLATLATDKIDEEDAELWSAANINGDSLAFLQYTSGSTSAPKGVMLSHKSLLHNEMMIQDCFQSHKDSIGVGWLPLYHDMGLIGNVLQPLYAEWHMVLMSPEDFIREPKRWLQAISKYKASISGGPNFAYELCNRRIKQEDKIKLDLSSWQVAYCGAERINADVVNRFNSNFKPQGYQQSAFLPCYGLAESCLMVAGANANRGPLFNTFDSSKLSLGKAEHKSDGRTLVGCGEPRPYQKLAIVDPKTHQRLAENSVGEVWVQGESIANGYWQTPEKSQQTFAAQIVGEDPNTHYLRTGDLGFLSKGELYISARLKDCIIINGRNIFPEDIELDIFTSDPALRQGCGAAFSIEEQGQEKLVVVQEIRKNKELDINQLIVKLQDNLMQQHQVSLHALVLIKEGSIKKTSSGKVQRHANKNAFLNDTLNVYSSWQQNSYKQDIAANQEIESTKVSNLKSLPDNWVRKIIANVLKQEPQLIDPSMPLSTYGLDSLLATELAGDFTKQLGSEVSPTVFYDYPSLNQLENYFSAKYIPSKEASLALETESSLDSISVTGMACNFPAADNIDSFWQLLTDNKNAISTASRERFDYQILAKEFPKLGGFIDNPDLFDPSFFNISPAEAIDMDPQQRILLETTWRAIEDNGLKLSALNGSKTGVFVGISTQDYLQLSSDPSALEPARATGNASCMAANRISYWLNLKGPSLAIDTACSSSLTAMHMAIQSIRNGECERAIVAGVNLILDASVSSTLAKAGMLSKDGQCKTFDSKANGYVRSEGCGVVILTKPSIAQFHLESEHAQVIGSAINHDGQTASLTAPNGPAQQAVIRQALADAKISMADIQYIETHGTGTPLGDPIEVGSLKQVCGDITDHAIYLGAVKSNIGHLESAAGIAGFIKTVLSLKHKIIPGNHNFTQLNPHIDLSNSPFRLPIKLSPWPTSNIRRAGLSGFGFGGANVHLILQQADENKTVNSPDKALTVRSDYQVLPLSCRSDAALEQYKKDILHFNHEHNDYHAVCQNILKKQTFSHRAALVVNSNQTLEEALMEKGQHTNTEGKLAFLFTGQGSQYLSMGVDLYQKNTEFKKHLDECNQYLERPLGYSLIELIRNDEERLKNTRYTQPVLFALGYSLAKTWLTAGLKPQALLGHSVGEITAACIAGVFNLSDACQLILARGRLMDELTNKGGMLAISASADTIQPLIKEDKATLALAAINGPKQTVVAGDTQALAKLEAKLIAKDIGSQLLEVSCAFHSPLMQPMLAKFKQILLSIKFNSAQLPLISNVTGEFSDSRISQVNYWLEHVLATVKFSQGISTLQAYGCSQFLEIGPQNTLNQLAQKCLTDKSIGQEKPRLWLTSLNKNKDDMHTWLSSLAELFNQGHHVDFALLEEPTKKIQLPGHPFIKQRYWREASSTHQENNQMRLTQSSSIDIPSPVTQAVQDSAAQRFKSKGLTMQEQIINLLQQQNAIVEKILKPDSNIGLEAQNQITNTIAQPAPVQERQVASSEIRNLVYQSVTQISGINSSELTDDLKLLDDLAFDSLMVASLATDLQTRMEKSAINGYQDQLMQIQHPKITLTEIIQHIYQAINGSTEEIKELTDSEKFSAMDSEDILTSAQKLSQRFSPQKLDQIDEVKYLRQQIDQAGQDNMFYRVNDGIANDTTSIEGRELINYSSYNYLGLNGSDKLKQAVDKAMEQYGTSASASRIISGEKPLHKELEQEIAQFIGTEDSLVYIGGFGANQCTISHLMSKGDLILHDALIHNSVIQGCIASGAQRRPFPHNDWQALDRMLEQVKHNYRRILVVVEGIYSQDGDILDLPGFIDIKNKHGVWLMVDEAHSIGVAGKTGRGVAEHFSISAKEVDIWMGTLSKSLASCGGYIAGSQELITYLKYTAPGFIYSCAITPTNTASALAALQQLQQEPERVERLNQLGNYMKQKAQALGLDTGLSNNTPIVPIIIGDSKVCMKLSHKLFIRGFNVLPIVHPAVEEERARLRFFVTAAHNEQQIDKTLLAITEELSLLQQDSLSTKTKDLV